MRGLIIAKQTNKLNFEASRVRSEAELLGCKVDLLFYDNFSLRFVDGQLQIYYENQLMNLAGYSWCFLRTTGNGGAKSKFPDLKTIIINELIDLGVRVLNGDSFSRLPQFSKLIQHHLFVRSGLPVVPSRYLDFSAENSKKYIYPLIAKIITGSQGVGVEKVDTSENLQKIMDFYGANKLLVQDYLPGKEDFRIIVLGGKILGAMKRIAPTESHLTNVSAGGSAVVVEPTQEQMDLAVKCADAFSLDYVGVDIMHDQAGKPYILELNRHAQFGGFEKATGINVAKATVEFLMSEVKANR